MTKAAMFAIAAGLMLTAPLSFAQDKTTAPPPGPPTILRGTIENFADNMITVKTGMGEVKATVTPKTGVQGVDARKLSDIKPNEFMGVTAMPGKDGMMHATEIHIFPEAMRGAGEGSRPFDRGPGSTMTNAAVAGMVDSTDGKTFTMSYKDKMSGAMKEVKIDVSPSIPIVAFVPGDQGLLKPGAQIVAFARKNPDGSLVALGIVAEKDGVKPPM
jgi:hypothetical protein